MENSFNQEFKDYICFRIFTHHSIYTVVIFECLDGTYELTITEKGIYINPSIFMDCDIMGLVAVNMTLDDVRKFCDAVRDFDVTNKKRGGRNGKRN